MKINRILVIRFRRVGDSVLSTAICTSLKKTFPDAKIDYVLNDNIASLYEGHPDIDQVITFTDEENHSFLKYVSKVWRVMRKGNYDVIVDTRSTIKTLFFSLFSLFTPYRIGTKKKYNFLVHNYRIDNHSDESTDMVKHNLMLLKPLEKVADVCYCPDFKLYASASEKEGFRTTMAEKGIDFSHPVILSTVTARLAYKVWDKERMKVILHRIIDKYNAQIIFNFAGDVEEKFAIELHKEMNNDKNIFTNIKADSLRELCALTVNCDFFFGNEGGPRHIAQALGIPSYAIFPPNILKSVWLPLFGDRYMGISPDDICPAEDQKEMDYLQRFNLITVDDVWSGLEKSLDKYLRK